MSSRLDRIKDWDKLAVRCQFSLQQMARDCSISPRQLRRYLQDQLQVNPKEWLDDLRWRAAATQLSKGDAVKSVAMDVGFKHTSDFTRFFKRLARQTPSKYQGNVPNG
jgi:AraC-like DNA-binding protein